MRLELMKIENITTGMVIAENCTVADSFLRRFAGLMGKKALPESGGLLLSPCNSIHMFFMRITLDLIFVDKNNIIVYLKENIKPWRVSRIVRSAVSVIELPAGTIKNTGTGVGDRLGIHALNINAS
jgi:uncharacterized protein